MLLDADIELRPGVVAGLKERLQNEEYAFISLMAMPSLNGFWEKMLMPAFVYFFKLLYPFRLANSNSGIVAAAAGGCIITKTEVLDRIGAFESIKGALIDDCMLARHVKSAGYRTWLGLTHSAKSIRPYGGLAEIWNMVARTAFTQLRYSLLLLLACTVIMILTYWVPVAGLFFGSGSMLIAASAALGIMLLTYIPTLQFYNLSWFWALALPVIAALFLAMTWTSAIRYWSGEQVRWRGRAVKRAF